MCNFHVIFLFFSIPFQYILQIPRVSTHCGLVLPQIADICIYIFTDKSAMAQLIPWCQFGARASVVPIMAKVLIAIWRHLALIGQLGFISN